MSSDGCDSIIVAGDDGVILDEGEQGGDRATLDEFGIIATDGGHRTTQCSKCSHEFDVDEARGSFDGNVALYVCPACGRGTEGPAPGERR